VSLRRFADVVASAAGGVHRLCTRSCGAVLPSYCPAGIEAAQRSSQPGEARDDSADGEPGR